MVKENNELRCMIKACLRRKLKRGCRFSADLYADLVQIYGQI